MPQAIWSGTISFGLVSVPVRLYPATRRKDVRFHEIDRQSGQRVRHQRVAPVGAPPSSRVEGDWTPGPREVTGSGVQERPREDAPARIVAAEVASTWPTPMRALPEIVTHASGFAFCARRLRPTK